MTRFVVFQPMRKNFLLEVQSASQFQTPIVEEQKLVSNIRRIHFELNFSVRALATGQAQASLSALIPARDIVLGLAVGSGQRAEGC